nr:dynein axonemal heavy chain 14 [Symphalangus syndactylus]
MARRKHAYRSRKPLSSWIDDLIQRLNLFKTWAKVAYTVIQRRYMRFFTVWKQSIPSSSQKCKHPEDSENNFFEGFPSRYWLPAFFFPQAFLAAVLQDYGRSQGISVDALTFTHHVISDTTDKDEKFSVFMPKKLNIGERLRAQLPLTLEFTFLVYSSRGQDESRTKHTGRLAASGDVL